MSQVGHLVQFTNNVRHDIRRNEFIGNKIMKDTLKVDNPIINKVDRYKCGPLLFSRTIIGVEV